MSAFLRLCFSLLLMVVSYSSSAAMFKCEDNGNISYSDKPCQGSGEDVTEKLKPIPQKAQGTTSRTDQTKMLLNRLQASRNKRQLEREIIAFKKTIKRKQQQRDKELAVLTEAKQSVAVDDEDEYLAIQLENKIAEEIKILSIKYAEEIKQLKIQLELMRERWGEMP